MEKMSAHDDSKRFESGTDDYAAYLQTPEGRLRLDLPFASLQEFLPVPQADFSPSALDVGCGTGANGLRLAQLGFQVTLLDSSLAMLDIAKRAAREVGLTEKIETKHGDADQIGDLFHEETFNVILCHNILEFVENPGAVLCGAARALRDSSAILSVLVRNRAGEVLKTALLAGDLAATEHSLTAEWGQDSLYKGKVRIFTPQGLKEMLKTASLAVTAERGVRVIADYLPPQISRVHEYDRICQLERKLGSWPDFASVARYTHCIAHRAG